MDNWEVVRSWESIKKYLPGGEKWKGDARYDNVVRIDQLPFYPELNQSEDLSNFRYVPPEPLPLQYEISQLRQFVQRRCAAVQRVCDRVNVGVRYTGQQCLYAQQYMRDDGSAVGKAAAIAVGGMAGLLMAVRKGRFRRMWYTTVGAGAVAAFCYPHETVDACRFVGARGRRTWNEFVTPPTPSRQSNRQISEEKFEEENDQNKNQDMDMYSTRSSKIE